MAKRKKSKSKKRKSKPREKKQTEINKLKQTLNDLAVRVTGNLDSIRRNTGMTNDQLISFIRNNGYEGLKKLPNCKISEPILNEMIKTFQLYDKIGSLITRMEQAERKLFISSLEQKTVDLEKKVAQVEEQEKFYTELPDDKGFVKMRDKWYAEKEFWEDKKADAINILIDLPEDQVAKESLAEAERNLKILAKKRNWARIKNIQPNIAKWTGKITKGVNTIQDSIGEIAKPFEEVGKVGYGSDKKSANEFEDMFTPEKVFGGSKKQKKEYTWDGGF